MILNANSLNIPLADKTVQVVITSPPYYGLRDYGTAKWQGGDPNCDHNPQKPDGGDRADRTLPLGRGGIYKDVCRCGAIRIDDQIGLEPTPDEYVAKLVQVFREVKRVLKDDGVLWLNLGDSYASLKSRYNQKAQSLNGGKSQDNVFQGNKTDLYHHKDLGFKDKDLLGIPWMVALALRADGWYLRSDIIWSKNNPMPESVKDRPTKAHEYVFLLAKSAKYYYDNEAIEEVATTEPHKFGWKNTPHETGIRQIDRADIIAAPDGSRNKRSVWTVNTQPFKGAHFAVMPEKLVEPCILAGSRPGDIVFDPFSGSGTTGRVAIRLGREFVGCELNYGYIRDISKRRLTVDVMLPGVLD